MTPERYSYVMSQLTELATLHPGDLGGWGDIRIYHTEADYVRDSLELRRVIDDLREKGVPEERIVKLMLSEGTETVQFAGPPRKEDLNARSDESATTHGD